MQAWIHLCHWLMPSSTSCAGGRDNMPPPPASWPFDLKSGVRVTCDVGYLCANFSLPRPLCSQLRPDVRDRKTSDRQTDRQTEWQTSDAHHRLMPSAYNNSLILQLRIRCRLKSFISCAFCGRLAALDFVMKCTAAMAVWWPQVWKFYTGLLHYYTFKLEAAMMQIMSG